jgi:uncharacterized protein YbbK (DUF523 family)
MVIVSACLLGIRCRYNGESQSEKILLSKIPDEIFIPVCPEQLGGLPTPRSSSEIEDGNGADVAYGRANVIDANGTDVTSSFICGAEETLRIARFFNITTAIMKENSPSCGVNYIKRKGMRVRGIGVATALLLQNGVNVISSDAIGEFYAGRHCNRK